MARYEIDIHTGKKKNIGPDIPIEVVVLPEEVKREAARRILLRYPMWMQINLLTEGGEQLETMIRFRDGVRESSNRIERMEPIPSDFERDPYWTAD